MRIRVHVCMRDYSVLVHVAAVMHGPTSTCVLLHVVFSRCDAPRDHATFVSKGLYTRTCTFAFIIRQKRSDTVEEP